MEILSFKLTDIASWQLDSEKTSVEIAALQRGFVWKVNQIESLWDSILRGFPVGSFLLSKSEEDNLFLLDGQQRATSIAIGYYNPWHISENKFWNLKNVPIIWIDLSPKEKTDTQKFVLRVVTQSHPWGYQRINHNSILSVSDRRNALEIFRKNPKNKNGGYVQLSLLNVFPYDTNLPIPLSFLIKAISENELLKSIKESLISMCNKLSVDFIETKHSNSSYIEELKKIFDSSDFENIYIAIKSLSEFQIPGIVVKKEILKAEDQQTGEDPTLFVRLNSSGTKIVGEEIIYSIYKASFPEAKKLVENIGANFVAPSLVISLVSRLVQSELKKSYPSLISVNDFRKRIQNEDFKNKLKELIGDEKDSPAKNLFYKALKILRSEDEFEIPPVLVKNLVKNSPELFLLVLKWLKLNDRELSKNEEQKILATITALVWFGSDNNRYVNEIWKDIQLENFWNRNILSDPFINKKDFIMYPLIKPDLLKEYLLDAVVERKILWNNLYPEIESKIASQYRDIFSKDLQENEIINSINSVWGRFIGKLFHNKSLLLFAQRKYINDSFKDFNQMESLEDTNSPWDWDHIYPASWVHGKWYIDPNTRTWTNAIGNLRAISLEENRSENNRLSPQVRLEKEEVREKSFIKENDWGYWSKIKERINDGDNEMIANHLNAIIHRLYNIYKEWYTTLKIDELFNFENDYNPLITD